MIPRYQTNAMTALWSDESQFSRWTLVEIAVCEAWHARGQIPDEEMEAIRKNASFGSVERIRQIEKDTRHELVAFVRALSESVPGSAARHLHKGLTSADVIDTALALTFRDSIDVLIGAARDLQAAMSLRAKEHRSTICAARTHGVHAEPTVFGLRIAGWFTEIARSIHRLEQARHELSFGKISGAIGCFSQTDPELEHFVLSKLGLQAEPLATQVVPRDRHASLMSVLALLGTGIERVATNIRTLQRTDIREVEEPFAAKQAGSSAMPHKRNPIISESLCGLARLLRSLMIASFDNVVLWDERDVSNLPVERITFADAFHLAHYMLLEMTRLFRDMRVYPDAMLQNIERSGGLLYSQSVLGAMLEAGASREHAYRLVQRCAMEVWEGRANHLRDALLSDADVTNILTKEALAAAFSPARFQQHVDVLFARSGIED